MRRPLSFEFVLAEPINSDFDSRSGALSASSNKPSRSMHSSASSLKPFIFSRMSEISSAVINPRFLLSMEYSSFLGMNP